MPRNREYWKGIIFAVNALMSILKRKPKSLRLGYQASAGGILNAYREGDLDFDQAVRALDKWRQSERVHPQSQHPDDKLIGEVLDAEEKREQDEQFRDVPRGDIP